MSETSHLSAALRCYSIEATRALAFFAAAFAALNLFLPGAGVAARSSDFAFAFAFALASGFVAATSAVPFLFGACL